MGPPAVARHEHSEARAPDRIGASFVAGRRGNSLQWQGYRVYYGRAHRRSRKAALRPNCPRKKTDPQTRFFNQCVSDDVDYS